MAGMHRHARVAVLAAAASACAVAGFGGSASAAQTTLQPADTAARTFASSAAGWTDRTDYGALVCVVGLTCPTGEGGFVASGGTAGSGDGHLRAEFGTLLGVLATTTVTFTSPAFTAPADTDAARLTVAVRPDVGDLLSVLGEVELGATLVDELAPARSTGLGSVEITAASDRFAPVAFDVPAGALVAGRSYRVRLSPAVTTTVSAVTTGDVDLDDVRLALTDLATPTDAPPTVTGAADSRTRTVTFEPGADVTDAAVEVLDGGGRVITTVSDADGDGSVAIELPDADGDYAVRVVRTNDAGESATSAAVAVQLDRTAPPGGGTPGDGSGGDGTAGGSGTGGGSGSGDGSGNGSGTGNGSGGNGSGGGNGSNGGNGQGGGTGTGGNGQNGGGGSADSLTDPGRFGALLARCFRGGDVVLTDVVAARGARVKVSGLTRYAPRTQVRIVDLRGRTVGKVRTDARGRFRGLAKAPARIAQRQRSGYRAVVGTKRSPLVRLRRANVLRRVSVARGVVTLRGRVDLRRAGKVRRIVALGGRGAAGCASPKTLRAVGRTRVNRRSGTYTLRVRAPRGSGRIVVRTRVIGSKLASRSSYAVR